MSSNLWYQPVRELTAEEMSSPWIVTDPSEVTQEKLTEYFVVLGKSFPEETIKTLAVSIQKAWRGHLCDNYVPRKGSAVLLGHLVDFALKYQSAIQCFKSLAPNAQKSCYLSKLPLPNGKALPIIVYGDYYVYFMPHQGLQSANDIPDLQAKCKPISDYAFGQMFSNFDYGSGRGVVANLPELYIKAMNRITDLRVVVAVDKSLFDKDFTIFDRIAADEGLRPVVVAVGNYSLPERREIFKNRAYRETYVCELDSMLPICLGKNRAVLISDNPDLCEKSAKEGVKVIACNCRCPSAFAELPQGQYNEITPELIRSLYIRAQMSVG